MQANNIGFTGKISGLKIRVSVVQIRPRAPFLPIYISILIDILGFFFGSLRATSFTV